VPQVRDEVRRRVEIRHWQAEFDIAACLGIPEIILGEPWPDMGTDLGTPTAASDVDLRPL